MTAAIEPWLRCCKRHWRGCAQQIGRAKLAHVAACELLNAGCARCHDIILELRKRWCVLVPTHFAGIFQSDWNSCQEARWQQTCRVELHCLLQIGRLEVLHRIGRGVVVETDVFAIFGSLRVASHFFCFSYSWAVFFFTCQTKKKGGTHGSL